jgi:hypothetical protein
METDEYIGRISEMSCSLIEYVAYTPARVCGASYPSQQPTEAFRGERVVDKCGHTTAARQ